MPCRFWRSSTSVLQSSARLRKPLRRRRCGHLCIVPPLKWRESMVIRHRPPSGFKRASTLTIHPASCACSARHSLPTSTAQIHKEDTRHNNNRYRPSHGLRRTPRLLNDEVAAKHPAHGLPFSSPCDGDLDLNAVCVDCEGFEESGSGLVNAKRVTSCTWRPLSSASARHRVVPK